jgi:hypothetical protein
MQGAHGLRFGVAGDQDLPVLELNADDGLEQSFHFTLGPLDAHFLSRNLNLHACRNFYG